MPEMEQVITDPTQRGYDPNATITSDQAAAMLSVTKNRVQQYARIWVQSAGTDGLPHTRKYTVYEFKVGDVLAFDEARKKHNAAMEADRQPGRRFNVRAGSVTANPRVPSRRNRHWVQQAAS